MPFLRNRRPGPSSPPPSFGTRVHQSCWRLWGPSGPPSPRAGGPACAYFAGGVRAFSPTECCPSSSVWQWTPRFLRGPCSPDHAVALVPFLGLSGCLRVCNGLLLHCPSSHATPSPSPTFAHATPAHHLARCCIVFFCGPGSGGPDARAIAAGCSPGPSASVASSCRARSRLGQRRRGWRRCSSPTGTGSGSSSPSAGSGSGSSRTRPLACRRSCLRLWRVFRLCQQPICYDGADPRKWWIRAGPRPSACSSEKEQRRRFG
mmetsp:Transcript_64553/g.135488  ORF Transcript_64553/g.135488 Transcript_64553/m.135488 type:complete len:261 (+) Transcript_64553:232-1014(+)